MGTKLLPSVARDYLMPLQERVLAPLYAWAGEFNQIKNIKTDNKECVKALQATVRLALSAGLTYGYRCAWKLGEHHFGPVGGSALQRLCIK